MMVCSSTELEKHWKVVVRSIGDVLATSPNKHKITHILFNL